MDEEKEPVCDGLEKKKVVMLTGIKMFLSAPKDYLFVFTTDQRNATELPGNNPETNTLQILCISASTDCYISETQKIFFVCKRG